MRFGVPKETKNNESRVALTPTGVRELVKRGHIVLIEPGAGEASGFADAAYRDAGGEVSPSAPEVWATADLIVKVKEPQPGEYALIREGSAIFAFLHLAANQPLAMALLDKRVFALAFETVRDSQSRFPILASMSTIAGQLAIHAAAHYLQRENGGIGKLLSRVSGAPPTVVAVIGAGTVGRSAASLALACGARVLLLNDTKDRLDQFAGDHQGLDLSTFVSSRETVEASLRSADVVVGAVYLPGRRPPTLAGRDLVRKMRQGSVIVDVAVDQGGCFATTRPTTHDDPVYREEGVIHFAVSNMPAAVPRTATEALATAALPYVLKIAEAGLVEAVLDDGGLLSSVSTYEGQVCDPGLAEVLGGEEKPFSDLVSCPSKN